MPFRELVGCSPSVSWNHYGFTGDEHDSEDNTEHTQFRQLSTVQGRWLSPDPYLGSMDLTNPQSFNRYAYVMNGPMNSFDPSGLQCVTLDNGVVGDDGTDPPCGSMTTGNGEPDATVNGDIPFWWIFAFLGSPAGKTPQQIICTVTGGCINSSVSTPGPTGNQAANLAGAIKNTLHTLACDMASPLASAAQATNGTVGAGIGGSAGIGAFFGAMGNAGVSVVADSQKNVGIALSFGYSFFNVWGVGYQAGRTFTLSNAATISDLKGPANGFSGSIMGVGGQATLSPDGTVLSGTVTVGPGRGIKMDPFGNERDLTLVPQSMSFNCSDVVRK